MKRRFVVIAQNASTDQQNILTQHFQGKGYGFWHWVADTWLITSHDPFDTTAAMRDTIKVLVPGLRVVVLYVPREQKGNWAVFGPSAWSEWLRKNWESD